MSISTPGCVRRERSLHILPGPVSADIVQVSVPPSAFRGMLS